MIEDVSPSIVGVINKQKASGLESFSVVTIPRIQTGQVILKKREQVQV